MVREFRSLAEDLENGVDVRVRLSNELFVHDEMKMTQLYDSMSASSFIMRADGLTRLEGTRSAGVPILD